MSDLLLLGLLGMGIGGFYGVLGTGIVVMVTVLGVLWMSGAPALQLCGVILGFVAAGAALALYEPYRRARLTGFLNPCDDVRGTGWQTIQ